MQSGGCVAWTENFKEACESVALPASAVAQQIAPILFSDKAATTQNQVRNALAIAPGVSVFTSRSGNSKQQQSRRSSVGEVLPSGAKAKRQAKGRLRAAAHQAALAAKAAGQEGSRRNCVNNGESQAEFSQEVKPTLMQTFPTWLGLVCR